MAVESVDELARQAIDLAKNALLVNVRFMSAAFSRLALMPVSHATLATDGAHLRYDPKDVVQTYAADSQAVARGFLHMVLHNVFLHLYPGSGVNELRWDTACDIAVEYVITELDLPAARAQHAPRQQATLARIQADVPVLTAETVYRYLLDQDLSDEDVRDMREPFLVDDHAPWHRMLVAEGDDKGKKGEGAAEETNEKSHDSAQRAAETYYNDDVEMPEEAKNAKKKHKSFRGTRDEDIPQKKSAETARIAQGERFADTINLDRNKEQWKAAAYEMGVQLDTYVKLWGTKGSNLSMALRAVTREKQDYRAFLRKFARMGEQMRINDDEFDYVYYCYGLSRYGNLPLIEPLEFAEERRIRDFVIAIDTSASTKDGLVRKFIEKTYSILSDETSFFARVNVRIVQCDAGITRVDTITCLDELEEYLEDLEIQGLGGTDFRPVFAYVDDALERGELTKLGGLIYFTDGHGTYPSRKPDYSTAFVFVDDYDNVQVPVWAMKVVLEETAIIDEAEPFAKGGS